MVLPIGFMCANKIELNIIKICVYSSFPAAPSPPHPLMHTYNTHMQPLKQGFYFLLEHNSFTNSFLNFLLQIHDLLLICPRILRNNNCLCT
jgi:hypothetical protein